LIFIGEDKRLGSPFESKALAPSGRLPSKLKISSPYSSFKNKLQDDTIKTSIIKIKNNVFFIKTSYNKGLILNITALPLYIKKFKIPSKIEKN